jgi:hypothetical protein
MPEEITEDKYRKLKIAIDVFSVFSIFIYIISFINPHWPKDLSIINEPGKMPIIGIIVLGNILPFIFSGIWLLFRYGEAIVKKFPVIENSNFRIISVLGLFIIIILIRGII